MIEAMRQTLGAHVRPEGDAIPTTIRNWPGITGRLRILCDPKVISYRGLTQEIIPFAWPDANDEPRLEERHEDFFLALMTAARETSSVIDTLLLHQWWKLGVVMPPNDQTFGVRDRKRVGVYTAVARPR